MLQLIYISTAASGMNEATVADILRASRLNNAAANVTGLLLYDGRRFLQALEGPTGEINAVFTRVKADGRHRAVVLLSSREVEERAFGNWAMAAERVAAGQGSSMVELVDELTAGITDRTVQAQFRSFARVRNAA